MVGMSIKQTQPWGSQGWEQVQQGSCHRRALQAERVACAESRALRELYPLLWASLGLGKSVGK